jgi:hypothetical protein
VARVGAADVRFSIPPFTACGPNARVYVIYTDAAGTRAALGAAARLARGLNLTLVLLAARRVPYPLPLDDPPVSVEFAEQAMHSLAGDLCVEVAVTILLCREPEETLHEAIGPEALVVMGTGKRWWRRPYRGLARKLKAEGRQLVLIN